MATVTRQNIATLHDIITVTVQPADYADTYEKSLKNYAKNANMPGFRKGMVPAGLVKKMYGQSVFTDEVLKAVEKNLFEYLETEKLDIFATPVAAQENDAKLLDQNKHIEYNFGFEIGLKPIFSIPDLSKANLTKYDVAVTDEMVNEEMTRLQRKHGVFSEPEQVNDVENVLNIAFKACDADGTVAENAEPKANSLLVKYFTKAYQDKLMGAKNGDTHTVKLNEAFEEKELEFVMQDLKETDANSNYQLSIEKVGLVTPAEFNEDFFKAAYPDMDVTTEAAAKEQLRKELEGYWAIQSNNQLQDGVFHYLVDNTTMEFPAAFLKQWMQTGREKQYTAEEVEAEYPKFSESLKWTLISDQINKDNGFKVEKEEISAYAKNQLLSYMGGQSMGGDTSWIDNYAEGMMKDKKFVEDTYHRVLTEKLFDWATANVSTQAKPISVEDFTKLVSEHKH
jgi:trigger factor